VPIIDKVIFESLVDRMAGDMMRIDHNAATMAPSGGSYYQLISVSNDPDTELPLLRRCRDADLAIGDSTSMRSVLVEHSGLVGMMNGIVAHARTVLVPASGNADGLCGSLGTTVPEAFNELHYVTRGGNMYARNVHKNDEITFGTLDGTDWSFTDGGALRTESYSARASGNQFAAATIRAFIESGEASDLVVDIIGINDAGEEVSARQTVNGLALESMPVASGMRWIDLTDVERVSGSLSGGLVSFMSVVDRQISL
jgi:hypothetical protein